MTRLIGLAGTHGCGKTTLARMAAEQIVEAGFVPTSISAVHKELGFDLKSPLTIAQRMEAQDRILERLTDEWTSGIASGYAVVFTDRTPFDLIAYLMADVSAYQPLDDLMLHRIDRYCHDCVDVAEQLFAHIVLIEGHLPPQVIDSQVSDKVRGLGVAAYQDHLELLIWGALAKSRLDYLVIDTSDLRERLESMRFIAGRALAA